MPERLAYENGFHQDAFDSLGALQAELFRAVRLVVDTGIHRKHWTRQQAIDYMAANTGIPETKVVTEIEAKTHGQRAARVDPRPASDHGRGAVGFVSAQNGEVNLQELPDLGGDRTDKVESHVDMLIHPATRCTSGVRSVRFIRRAGRAHPYERRR